MIDIALGGPRTGGAEAEAFTPPVRERPRASPWARFARKRAIGLAVTFAVVVIVTFIIVPLIPGDPAVSAAGSDASLERIEQVREELRLTDPLPVRFVHYVGGIFRGDLGTSFSLNAPVTEIVLGRLPFTALLAGASILVVLLVAVPVGMAVGVLTRNGRRRWLDVSFGFVSGLIAAIPPYVMATLLVALFAVTLQLLPPAYVRSSPGASLILPALALSLGPITTIARVVRRETAVVLEQDYMRTARGWRLSSLRMYAKFALPNLFTSTLTLTGLILTSMIGGAIIVETIFSWPGLGLAIVNAILEKDYPLIQGIILVLAMLAAVLTLLVDMLLGLIDARTLGEQHD